MEMTGSDHYCLKGYGFQSLKFILLTTFLRTVNHKISDRRLLVKMHFYTLRLV